MNKPTMTTQTRKPWTRPIVEKIAAGQAEGSTRSNNTDADFQTS